MAKIKIDGMVSQLEREIKKALTSTLHKEFGDIDFNIKDVYATFKNEIIDKCNSWEEIPNKFIKS